MAHRRLVDLVDKFIPYEIWRSRPEPAVIARARMLVSVLGLSILVPAIGLLIVLAMHFFTGHDFGPAMVALGAILLLVVTQHAIFQAYANLNVMGTALSVTCFLSLALATACTGGWHSPVLLLLFCTPIIVFLISGWRTAEYTVVLTFASGVLFMVLEIAHWSLPNIMHEENRDFAQGLIWFLSSLVMLLLFYTQQWVQGLENDASRNGSTSFDPPITEAAAPGSASADSAPEGQDS